jgi:virulence-associated protein VapD
LAVQELVKRHPWIRFAVRDIRMLRVEETNDLMSALGRQVSLFDTASGM